MAIATGSIGLATSAAKFFEGKAMQKKGQEAIDNFQWQDLTNPYENLEVSTIGSDLRKETQQIGEATAIDALGKGGARALVGGLGKVQANRNVVNKEIAAGLDEKQKQIDFAAAGQDVRNQAMKEKREADELAGYGNMMNTGLGMKQGAYGDLLNTAGFVGQTDIGKSADASIGNWIKGN